MRKMWCQCILIGRMEGADERARIARVSSCHLFVGAKEDKRILQVSQRRTDCLSERFLEEKIAN